VTRPDLDSCAGLQLITLLCNHLRFAVSISCAPGCRVAGGEAVQFFTRTGLPKGDLSVVWRAAKRAAPAEGEGLTQQQFAAALRVVAYAQVCPPLCRCPLHL
jgi:hypothetical protein